MKSILTLSALFFLSAVKAQDLRSVTIKSKTVEIKYDSTVQTPGIQYDTLIKKSWRKYKGNADFTIDTTSSQTRITRGETITVIKSFQKPVEMKFLFSTMTASVFALTINGQTFNASKYGFGWFTDTTAAIIPPPPSSTTYGALWATWSGSQALTATGTFYPFNEIRSLVMFSSWNGTNSPITEQYLTSNREVVLNVHDFSQDGSHHYSEINLTTWQANVTTLVNSISKPTEVLLSSFNEEANRNYSIIETPSDMEKYVQATSILGRVANTRDIKVSNGGITTNSLVFTTYRYLSDIHSSDTIDFLHYVVPANWWNAIRNRNNSAVEEIISNTQYLLTRYDTIPAQYLPYISAHLYFPLALRMTDTSTTWNTTYTGIEQIAAMLNYYVPGRELITNESGFLVENSDLITNVVHDLHASNFRHVIYWNSPSGVDEVMPIATDPLIPTTLGHSYKAILVE
jgi:hypothetical protein